MFSRSTNADRDRRCADLLQRAELVRTHGWEDYRAVWVGRRGRRRSALLGDHDVLGELDETLQSVWARFSFDLWGVTDGQAEVANHCKLTRRWFIDTAQGL
jgi:hypothetical protein